MRRQGIHSTKVKPPDTDLEDKIKKNVVFCRTVDPSQKKKEKFTQVYAYGSSPLQVGETNSFTACVCIILIQYSLQQRRK